VVVCVCRESWYVHVYVDERGTEREIVKDLNGVSEKRVRESVCVCVCVCICLFFETECMCVC
jgi:hypothetical protein